MKKLKIRMIPLLLLFLIFFGVPAHSALATPQVQLDALMAFYNATNGEIPDYCNWGVGTDASTWSGITCDASGNVISIELRRYSLTGSIPADLANLTYLKFLRLNNNQLTGSIPVELGNLTNLLELELGSNQLTGNIPAALGNLTKLNYLSLAWNQQLTGNIPAELGNLTNLYYLELNSNQLTGNIPPELGNLTKLVDLSLSYNQLTGNIPTELGNLTKLHGLTLSSNQLTGNIPAELGNLIDLHWLYLHNNQLSGSIPIELMNIKDLWIIFLCGNRLYTTDPDLRAFLNDVSPGWEKCQLPAIIGDVNNDAVIDLADAIINLKLCSGMNLSENINIRADINGDNKIGIEEAIHALQHTAGIR